MNQTKYIDQYPPAGNDPDIWSKILDYLAYLRERINFALNHLTRRLDKTTGNGYIGRLTAGAVEFSNGLAITRGRYQQAPDSSSGVAVGSTGWYRYTLTIDLTGTAVEGATVRPLVIGDVWVMTADEGYPACCRIDGQSGAWQTLHCEFYHPVSTLSHQCVMECLVVYTR